MNAPDVVEVDLTVTITVAPGHDRNDVVRAVEDACAAHVRGVGSDHLGAALLAIDGVAGVELP